MAENFDELMQQMKHDEYHDATKLSPIEYGKLRNISPQLVYYHIKQKHIDIEFCLCGRKVIDVEGADMYFKRGKFSPNINGSMATEEEQ